MTAGSLDVGLAMELAERVGSGGLIGGVSPGAGAQGTKDGPLGVGPMPVLSEPLGSSISDHRSAGLVLCRDRPFAPRSWTLSTGALVGQSTVHRSANARHVSVVRPQARDMAHSRKSARRRRRQSPQTRFRVRRPDELLAIIPYMIGFHPDESIVAVFLSSGRIRLMARMNLPPESASDELAERIDGLARQHEAHALALVAYSAASLPANRLLTRLMERLDKHKLTDVLYVGHGRWWSLICGDEWCPLIGTPFDPGSHRVSAEAVFAGLGARASRQELEASISGPSQADLPRLEALAEVLRTELDQLEASTAAVRLLASTVREARSEAGVLDERSCLLLALLVTDIRLRDLAWALISPADAEDHIRLWGSVVALVPPRLAAAPLCLLGMAAWLSGAGALLNCCCERLAQVAPQYSLGTLLVAISDRALPPSLWHQIGGEIQSSVRGELGLLAG